MDTDQTRRTAEAVAQLSNDRLVQLRHEDLSTYATVGARFQLAALACGLDIHEDTDVILAVLSAVMVVGDQVDLPAEVVLAGALHVAANFR